VTLAGYIEALKKYKGFLQDIVCHKTLGSREARFASKNPEFKNDYPHF